jgi:RHS repeat-associated protein
VPPGTSTVEVKATDASGNVATNVYEISQAGAAESFTYDANGNLTSDGAKTYEWDAENRLTAVKQGGNMLASFTYDGLGRRSTKTTGGITAAYVYDSDDVAEERLSGADSGTVRYYHGAGVDDRFARQNAAGAINYLLADHLGSIVQETNSAGEVTLARSYDPWGNLDLTGASLSGPSFTGREWDAETGLYYYRARYYKPTLARFMTEDPIDFSGNPYRYVRNRPLVSVDPSGMVDLNIFKPGTKEWWPAEQVPSYGGEFSVAAHGAYRGGPERLYATTSLADPHSESQLAGKIRGHKKWKAGKPVRLWACNAALPKKVGASFAQRLADELCTDVWAPTGLIYFNDLRGLGFSRDWQADLTGDATWKKFKPSKK